MKTTPVSLAAAFSATVLLSACSAPGGAGRVAGELSLRDAADAVQVEAAIEDYVLGFYDAEPDRLARVLSPDLVKLGYWRESPDQDYSDVSSMSFEQALALASQWNADGQRGADMPYEITLFEVADKTAVGKLTAVWGQDYFLLSKSDGAWTIHQILWQSAPPAE